MRPSFMASCKRMAQTLVVATAALCFCCIAVFLPAAHSFVTSSVTRTYPRRNSASAVVVLKMKQGQEEELRRRNVKMPLLDLENSNYNIITPLPSSHLPRELRTRNMYGVQLDRPIHKMLIEEAWKTTRENLLDHFYGHLVYKPSGDSLIGAIGCVVDIMVRLPSEDILSADVQDRSNIVPVTSDTDGVPVTFLGKGSFRFVVKEVIKTFPYPVAIVDELIDENVVKEEKEEDDVLKDNKEESMIEDNDVEDEDDSYYNDLDAPELVTRTLSALKQLVDQKLSEVSNIKHLPYEKAMWADSGKRKAGVKKNQAEEMSAVYDVFAPTLADICPLPTDQYYAIAMMAAEMAYFDNEMRAKLLKMTNGVERLRLVLKLIEEETTLGMTARDRKTTNTLRDQKQNDEQKNLPELPKWASYIKKGTRLEYYRNEEKGWCGCVVVKPPFRVVDELIITVMFLGYETLRLPFRADEKERWRPAQK